MNILNLEPENYDRDTRALLELAGTVTYHDAHADSPATGPFSAVCLKLGIMADAPWMDNYPGLRYLLTPTTGLTHIDLDAAAARGIAVISLKGETAFLSTITSTAEHTWALLLALVRRLPAALADVRAGNWQRHPFMATELRGKTLGIVGCGRLGRIVAGYGRAFGMDVLVHDRDAAQAGAAGFVNTPLETLLGASDVVSLHIPYEPANRHMIDVERLAQMKPGALLINTARGEVLDETALLAALASGRLAGAALDVLDEDSSWPQQSPVGHLLIEAAKTYPQLLITPHTGGYAREAITRTRRFIVEKFLAHTGLPIVHPFLSN
ncbi:MAG: hypothetical protein OHK0039_21060 [Bacteroidia bacterium]